MTRSRLRYLTGIWSASKLFTLFDCPKKFFFAYVLTGEERFRLQKEFGWFPMPAELAFGDVVHYMLRRFFAVRFKSPTSFARQIYGHWLGVAERRHNPKGFSVRSAADKIEIQRPLDFRTPEDRERYSRLTFVIGHQFFERNLPYREGVWPRPVLERMISKNIRIRPGINLVIRGQLDRIQPLETTPFPVSRSPYRIWDYKTGFLLKAEEAKRKEQQLFYRLLTSIEYGYEAEGFDFLQIPGLEMLSVEYNHSAAEQARVVEQVEMWLKEAWAYVIATLDRRAKLINNIKWDVLDPAMLTPGEFAIRPGKRCERCEFKSVCDVGAARSVKDALMRFERWLLSANADGAQLNLVLKPMGMD